MRYKLENFKIDNKENFVFELSYEEKPEYILNGTFRLKDPETIRKTKIIKLEKDYFKHNAIEISLISHFLHFFNKYKEYPEIKDLFSIQEKTYNTRHIPKLEESLSYEYIFDIESHPREKGVGSNREIYYENTKKTINFNTYLFKEEMKKIISLKLDSLIPKNLDYDIYFNNSNKNKVDLYIKNKDFAMLGKPKTSKGNQVNFYDNPSIPFHISLIEKEMNSKNQVPFDIEFLDDYKELFNTQVLNYWENYEILLIDKKENIYKNFENEKTENLLKNLKNKDYFKSFVLKGNENILNILKKQNLLPDNKLKEEITEQMELN